MAKGNSRRKCTAQLFVTNKASQEQRQALINIILGQAKGDGQFVDMFAGNLDILFGNNKCNGEGSKYRALT
jgi:hypothetical protein